MAKAVVATYSTPKSAVAMAIGHSGHTCGAALQITQ